MVAQAYYADPYKKELTTKIVSVSPKGSFVEIVLSQTIFYPEGGGQPSDKGVIQGKDGKVIVEFVRLINSKIVHQGKLEGNLKKGDKIQAVLDWSWRYKYMRIHTAGHLLHDVLVAMYNNLIPIRGSHGKKPFLEYKGTISQADKAIIEQKVNVTLLSDLPIVTNEATYEEIKEESQFVPENLPRNKSLRMIRIGEYPAMPDGGVHVKSTREIGKIWIANIINSNDNTTIRYGVAEK